MKPLFSFLLLCLGATASAQTDTTLNEFKGVYRFPDGSAVSTVEVSVQEKILYITSSIGGSNMPRINKDTFNLEAYGGTVIFRRDKEGRVKGIYIDAGGTILEGDRQKDLPMAWNRRRNLVSR